MAQVIRSPKIYDVCIIGSGAAGGAAAKVLTEGGVSVVMLEAGPRAQPSEGLQRASLALRSSPSRRGRGRKTERRGSRRIYGAKRRLGDRGRTLRFGPRIHVPLVPLADCRWPHQPLGTEWRCASRRMDFKPRSTDGMGDDWPITYEELAPYYDKVESYIGVFGTRENIPSSPDGIFLPPPKPRCTETILKKACDKVNILCVPARMAILTLPLNGRAACHYCGQCTRGCKSASNFSSSQVLIPPALATGRLTLITNAMAGKSSSARMARPKPFPTSTEPQELRSECMPEVL